MDHLNDYVPPGEPGRCGASFVYDPDGPWGPRATDCSRRAGHTDARHYNEDSRHLTTPAVPSEAPPEPKPFDYHTPLDAGAKVAEREQEESLRRSLEAADEIGRILRAPPESGQEGRAVVREILARVGVTESTVGIATHRALVKDLLRAARPPRERQGEERAQPRIIDTEDGPLDLGPEYEATWALAEVFRDWFDFDGGDALMQAIEVVDHYDLNDWHIPGHPPRTEEEA